MKILIAPDSMKESLTAEEVSLNIQKGIRKIFADAEIVRVPMADGGEGTVAALVDATGGRIINAEVYDPLFRNVNAFFGVLGDGETAVIEVAAASGLGLLTKDERNPMIASSYGTGELIVKALDEGCRKFILGLGGSAVNDAGAGILEALGAEIMDAEGMNVTDGGGGLLNATKIDITNLDNRLHECSFVLACDVNNPLTGKNGASEIFAPQKGATPEMVKVLENALSNYAGLLKVAKGIDVATIPGTGAAGGIAATLLTYFKTEIKPGFNLIGEIAGLTDKAKNSDLIFTAEGKTESQTLAGKVPYGVAKLGKQLNVPVMLLTGSIGEGAEQLYEYGITAIVPLADKPMDLETSMDRAAELLERAAERICRIFKAGLK